MSQTSILNNPYCGVGVGNTGLSQCPIDIKLVKGGAFVPVNFNVPASAMASLSAFKAYVQALTLAPGGQRIFPLPAFDAVQDQSTEPKEETLAFGAIQVIMEGKMIHTFRFLTGGLDMVAQLRKFNGKSYKVIFFTDSQVIGTQDGEGGMLGFQTYQIYTYPIRLADGSKGNEYRIKIGEENASEWDRYAVVDCSVGDVPFSPITAFQGILDVTLEAVHSSVTDIILNVFTRADKIDLVSPYATELATPDAWVVKDLTGILQTVTSVATDADNGELTLTGTFDAGGVTVSMANPADLAALDIGGGPVSGYESIVLTINPYST